VRTVGKPDSASECTLSVKSPIRGMHSVTGNLPKLSESCDPWLPINRRFADAPWRGDCWALQSPSSTPSDFRPDEWCVPCDAESTNSRESLCFPWDSTHRSRCEEPQCAHWLDPAIGPRGSDLLCLFHPEPFSHAPHDGTYGMGSDLVRASATVGCDSFAGSCSPLMGLAREDRLLPCIRARSLSRRLGCHTRPIVRTQWEGGASKQTCRGTVLRTSV
jgi:hypothetical protein